MKWIIGMSVVMALIAIYVTWLRPFMQKTQWGQALLAKIEPIERVLWWKSETILWARAKMVSGILLTGLIQIGAVDITPLMPLIPDQYEGIVRFAWGILPLVVTAMGWIDQNLRFNTTKPIEIVGMRTDAPEEVKAAAEQTEMQMQEVVAEAKKTGSV